MFMEPRLERCFLETRAGSCEESGIPSIGNHKKSGQPEGRPERGTKELLLGGWLTTALRARLGDLGGGPTTAAVRPVTARGDVRGEF